MPSSRTQASQPTPAANPQAEFLNGTAIVPGVSYGRCVILAGDDLLQNAPLQHANDPAAEKALLRKALKNTRETLLVSAKQVQEILTEADERIFQMYEGLLDDPMLLERIQKFLEDGFALPAALSLTARAFQQEFQDIQDEYLRERLLDVQDILLRLMDAIRNLGAECSESEDEKNPPQDSSMPILLVARELFPSQFLSMPLKRICGIVCESGGATSHAAILARALRIPMMVNVPGIQNAVTFQDKMLLDCRAGLCFINPAAKLLKQYQLALNISRRSRQAQQTGIPIPVDDHPMTLDGTPIHLCGNITLFSEIPALHAAGIREIGLYRTEFMFMIRNNMPDEETQYRVLNRLVGGAEGAPVVIRALDIGGDKQLSYIPWGQELNPSLGWRGLRFLLTNPEIALTHLRAILRACVSRNVRLLFPMVADVADIRRAKELVREAQGSLAADGLKYGDPSIGMMLELPSAAFALERLLPEVDFVSIGTNDLVQYLLAVDRSNSRVTRWYQQCHPVIMRLLGQVCQTMAAFPEKDLEICGEVGANISALPALLGAGLRKFSMNPSAVPNIRDLIRKVRLDDCQELYSQICEADTTEQVLRLLDDFMQSVRQ